MTRVHGSWGVLHEVMNANHDDVIKWKHFPRYWPFYILLSYFVKIPTVYKNAFSCNVMMQINWHLYNKQRFIMKQMTVNAQCVTDPCPWNTDINAVIIQTYVWSNKIDDPKGCATIETSWRICVSNKLKFTMELKICVKYPSTIEGRSHFISMTYLIVGPFNTSWAW